MAFTAGQKEDLDRAPCLVFCVFTRQPLKEIIIPLLSPYSPTRAVATSLGGADLK